MNIDSYSDRVLGSLAGACIGDAMGAATEQLTMAEIRQRWGGRVETFVDPPAHGSYASGRRAGQLTDDSSQLIGIMDAYLDDGGVLTVEAMARTLIAWSQTEYFPRFAGPSTKRAIEALLAGADPRTQGATGTLPSDGTTNGAAMRIAPAGLRHPGNLDAAVLDALTSCRPSHLTSIGVAGAAAMAAAVSAAVIEGASLLSVIDAARKGAALGAQLGREHGRETTGPEVGQRIELAVTTVIKCGSFDEAVTAISRTVGTGLSMVEAVPAAIGIFLAAEGDPFLACVGGTNAGDDTDTVACMAGALAGAFRGYSAVPRELYETVVKVNELDLEGRARAFATLVVNTATT